MTWSPEGISFDNERQLTRALLAEGERVFSFSYHSPSLAPGNTPYVQNEADLRGFLRRIEQYLEFFAGELGGRAVTPFEVKALAERCSWSRDTAPEPAREPGSVQRNG